MINNNNNWGGVGNSDYRNRNTKTWPTGSGDKWVVKESFNGGWW